ncbi:MAG: SDR family oxidoreductase, partial [Candidatus Thermoplasmatota archaeon]|nr:SDR family oxidoreductase [Candidatus Thermoplasmatota archaeon]
RATVDAVEAAGRKAALLQADLADPDQAMRLGQQALDAFHHLDTVINNAGTYPRLPVDEVDPAEWDRVMATNVAGAHTLTRELIAHMREAGGGRIVNLSSILAQYGSSHGVHYSASKAAVLGYTRALARELAGENILVNAICPGYIETDMLKQDTPEKRAERNARVPMGRVGQPEEIAGVVSFLVGPDASYMTGQTLHVNGGLLIT